MLHIVGGAFAADAQPTLNAPSTPPPLAIEKLLPLSAEDEESSHQTGCVFSFGDYHRDYVQLIDDELMFRTLSGLQVCRIANPDAFMLAEDTAACSGILLKLHRTAHAPQQDSVTDSAGGAAQLSIGQGRVSRTMRGGWAVAC
jgi:hypothetical protein